MPAELIIIGHRGAAGLTPENTLPSFKRALEIGCRHIELDVHPVADRGGMNLAVIHDTTLKRTTGRPGRVRDFTLQALQEMDAGGATIPCLDEVFDLLVRFAATAGLKPDQLTVNVELKGKGSAPVVADFMQRRIGPMPATLFSSFDHKQLFTLHSVLPELHLAPLYDRWDSRWLKTAQALQAKAVNLSWKLCKPVRVQQINEAGYPVFAYTVNEIELAADLQRMGVAGVFTDRPDLLLGDQPASRSSARSS